MTYEDIEEHRERGLANIAETQFYAVPLDSLQSHINMFHEYDSEVALSTYTEHDYATLEPNEEKVSYQVYYMHA